MRDKISLSDSVTVLRGVGSGLENKLVKLKIKTVQDVLFHLPCRYIDRTRLTPIRDLIPGDYAYIQGEIEYNQVIYGKRRSLLCRIADKTGFVLLRFFYFSNFQVNKFKKGNIIRCYGQVRRGSKSLEMVHPEYKCIDNFDIELDEKLMAVYPKTEGLQQANLRKLSQQALAVLHQDRESLEELLPDNILSFRKLAKLHDALEYIHSPPPDADIVSLEEGSHPATQRIIYEELLAYQLSLLDLRSKLHKKQAPAFAESKKLVSELLKKLPFKLTCSQNNAYKMIAKDLNKNVAMLRLLQGDVGSGKTIVGLLIALQVLESNYQVAFMVPTELLAEQHFINLKKWLDLFNIEIYFLSGKLKETEKREVLVKLKKNKPLLVIGTHALFQDRVQFCKLGLVIIDEQHRFGVHQRLALFEKSSVHKKYAHQLIMTATPIPRTLAMTAYADLDHTVIDELPPNRKNINTSIISKERRDEVIKRINNICIEGRQVYWVCPLIEESEKLQCESAVYTYEVLKKKLPSLNIGLVHGKMKNNEKEIVMQDFKSNKVNLLVSTTVIEVGVDIPNASLIVIENSERFGLSQLHQLRGRIGRSEIKSYCILMYKPPLSDVAKQRLEALRASGDGFYIAEKDLELRGPGEVLGIRQAGMPSMRIANLMRDVKLLPFIQETAKLMRDKYPKQAKSLIKRWFGDNIDNYSNT